MTLLLVLQLLFDISAHVTYTLRQFGPDAVVLVTYPATGSPLRACSVFYEGFYLPYDTDRREFDRHCWTPTNPVGDLDLWKNFNTAGTYLICEVTFRRPDGRVETEYAYPIPGET